MFGARASVVQGNEKELAVDDSQARARFERMFDEHWVAVVAYAARRSGSVDPEDVAAVVFTNAWRHLDGIPASAELPWLLRSASNQVVTSWQQTRRTVPSPEPRDSESPRADHEQRLDVQAALERLDDDDREVLALTCWDQLTSKEAAAVLGCRPGTYRVRLHRARLRLKRVLGRPMATSKRSRTATTPGGTA